MHWIQPAPAGWTLVVRKPWVARNQPQCEYLYQKHYKSGLPFLSYFSFLSLPPSTFSLLSFSLSQVSLSAHYWKYLLLPGEGNGNPVQYSCLEKFHGQRSLASYSPWGCKESDMTKQLNKNSGISPVFTWNRSEDRHFTQVGLTVVTNIDTWVQIQLNEARTSGDDMQILLYF